MMKRKRQHLTNQLLLILVSLVLSSSPLNTVAFNSHGYCSRPTQLTPPTTVRNNNNVVLILSRRSSRINNNLTKLNTASEKTYYEILGADPKASTNEIKKCYYDLARKTHPDRTGSDADDYSQNDNLPDFNQISMAWKTLSDPKERKRYDQQLFSKRMTKGFNKVFKDFVFGVAEMIFPKPTLPDVLFAAGDHVEFVAGKYKGLFGIVEYSPMTRMKVRVRINGDVSNSKEGEVVFVMKKSIARAKPFFAS